MAGKGPYNLRSALTYLVAAYVVVATYTIWAFKAWHGDAANVLVIGLAVVITAAGAITIFGMKRMTGALDLVNEARGLAQEVRELREQNEEE